MTVAAAPCIKDGSLIVNGKVILTGVPLNVDVYPVTDGVPSSFSAPYAAFLGARSSVPSSRHVFAIGVLQHKIWWMIPRFGNSGSDIPIETQMLLLEVKEEPAVCDEGFSEQSAGKTVYVLVLPVLEGQFRATLQGNSANELEFCTESGDANVQTTKVSESVFVNSGVNPFELIKESFKILEKLKGTFLNVEHKKKPTHLDWFGWCTWDAFYRDVSTAGIKEGLQSLVEGGCPPKFLVIDDGWQDTYNDFEKAGEVFVEGMQFASRLFDLKESSKFMASDVDISCSDLQELVKIIKEKYGVNQVRRYTATKMPTLGGNQQVKKYGRYVYMWHALVGYWGGLHPLSEKLQKYNQKLMYPVQSPGNIGNLRDIAMDSLEKYGVGLIDPEKIFDFYNDLHSYLSQCGVDGVKVDIQNVLETLGGGHGGRVSLTRKYQNALEESVAKNFKENNLICSMSLNNDYIFSSKRGAAARVSEDFMPRETTFQTVHVASVAFNSLLLGEIVAPDWDMFQTSHYTAEFHGAARSVGGCPIYVSDKPHTYDFNVLKKLVLPDGSVLRAKYPGRPTLDCLFVDMVMDGKSLMKIWNLNKLSGLVGVFNCQGAGNWPWRYRPEYKPDSSTNSVVLSGRVSPQDIDFLREVVDESCNGECAVYAFRKGSLSRLSNEGSIEVTLATFEYEVFTISPIRVLNETIQFAPIGLINMYNSGGATEGLSLTSQTTVTIQARGCGHFGVYSSKEPAFCTVDGNKEEFKYEPDTGLLIVKLEGECKTRGISIYY